MRARDHAAMVNYGDVALGVEAALPADFRLPDSSPGPSTPPPSPTPEGPDVGEPFSCTLR